MEENKIQINIQEAKTDSLVTTNRSSPTYAYPVVHLKIISISWDSPFQQIMSVTKKCVFAKKAR
jgi:hypothetical protein